MKEPIGPHAEGDRYLLALQESMRKFRGKVIPLIPFRGKVIQNRPASFSLRSVFPNFTRGSKCLPQLDERGGFVIDLRDRCDA